MYNIRELGRSDQTTDGHVNATCDTRWATVVVVVVVVGGLVGAMIQQCS